MGNPRPIILALAFGLIAVVLVYLYVKQVERSGGDSDIEMATVVRATQKISPKQVITKDMVEEVEVQADFVTADMVTEMDEILGDVSVVAIYENQPIMYQMFKSEEQIPSISFQLLQGERAVTVGVTEVSGLGGNLDPGDRVDVLVSILDNEEVGVASTFTVLRDVGVMAVGQNIGFEEDETTISPTGQVSKSVTLRVTPSESEVLALASEVGSIRLALRNPQDKFSPALGGTALTDFATYTATRKDLEDAADRARKEAMELRRLMAQSPTGPVVPTGPREVPMPQTPKAPVDLVQVILGGESTFVELPR